MDFAGFVGFGAWCFSGQGEAGRGHADDLQVRRLRDYDPGRPYQRLLAGTCQARLEVQSAALQLWHVEHFDRSGAEHRQRQASGCRRGRQQRAYHQLRWPCQGLRQGLDGSLSRRSQYQISSQPASLEAAGAVLPSSAPKVRSAHISLDAASNGCLWFMAGKCRGGFTLTGFLPWCRSGHLPWPLDALWLRRSKSHHLEACTACVGMVYA